MNCPNCGQETVGKFCPACGAKMPAPDETVVLNDANNPWKQAKAAEAEKTASVSTQPAPAQSYAPNQGFVPNQPAPGQPAPYQGFIPGQPTPAQPAPNQGGAPYSGGYIPAQGSSLSQNSGSFQDENPAEVGKTPASQLIRKIASSGPWVVAVLASTLSFLVSLGYFIYTLAANPLVNAKDYAVSTVPGLVGTAILVLLLWAILGSAAGKRKDRMGTGALTTFKVFFIIALVFICIALALVVVFGVLVLVLGSRIGQLDEYTAALQEALRQYNIDLMGLNLNISTLIGVIFGIFALILVIALIFAVKVIKSLNTAKRVIQTGRPDDRVSVFVAVFCILGAICTLFCGIGILLVENISEVYAAAGLYMDKLGFLATAIGFILNAIAAFCFALVIFRFRSGMRQLGVRKGIMQRPV